MFDEMTAQRQAKRGSRAGGDKNAHPATRRSYLLRGMVLCACGRRMFGNQRRNSAYYMCWPRNNNRGRPDTYAGHPKTVYLREDAILDAVSRFFADRVFGQQRRGLLAAELDSVDDREAQQRHAERERLQRVLADIARRQDSILRQAADGDPDDPFTKGLRGSYNDLEAQKNATLAAVAELDAADEAEPAKPSADDTALLDHLPYLALNLAHAPEALLRRLFETTQLTVALNGDTDEVTITIKLPADDLPHIAQAAERITETMPSTHNTPAQPAGAGSVDAVRAPGRIRTCDTRFRRELIRRAWGAYLRLCCRCVRTTLR
ncbi:zinc ribbon domain-containing protein [Saccharomonospora sp. CUA-673]|uniref:zinc ribbon domain-containing protein n=1 Tax=Saccharomonospora sp. CUA-673 TaxID=1904969 RepID=UPI0021014DAB|nr:zinc ribbon domain-containing protein [Saccharomonospora sp. CUA-673]